MRINGAPASVNSLSEWLSVLWLTPAMDRLFLGSAGDRRRFLDRLVLALEPGHAHHSARYEAAMRARNKLLAEESPDAAWLTALEEAMAEHGSAIAEARARTVAALDERLADAPDDEFARAAIALEGWDRRRSCPALAAIARRDAAAGRAIEGPTGRISPSHTAPRDARGAVVDRRAEGAPARTRPCPCGAGRRAPWRTARSCCSTKSLRISIRYAAPALFARLEGRGQVWMTATEAHCSRASATHRASTFEPGRVTPSDA